MRSFCRRPLAITLATDGNSQGADDARKSRRITTQFIEGGLFRVSGVQRDEEQGPNLGTGPLGY